MAIEVLYDDHCGICRGNVAWMRRLDWRGAMTFQPISTHDFSAAQQRLGDKAPTADDLHAAIHVLTPTGGVHRGMRALRQIAWAAPLLWPVALLLAVPGMVWILEPLYRWVAQRRLLISRRLGCSTGACEIRR